MNGILVVFEGIDGAGKTTQVNMLAAALESAGEDVLVSKEPTAGQWGQKIRDSAAAGRMPLDEELEAFIRDREEHLEQKIKPALVSGKVVILDRYFYSTIAYQGARGGNVERLDREVRELALEPDIVFVLDLDPVVAVSRIGKRDGAPNAFESVADLAQVREVFTQLVEKDPLLKMLDGAFPIELLHREIITLLVYGVLKEKRCAKSYGCDDPYYCSFRMTNSCRWWAMKKALELNKKSDFGVS